MFILGLMSPKTNKKIDESKYTEQQRRTLIACTAVMAIYIVLAYFITSGSFWSFAAFHVVLMAVSIFFIWLGGAPKVMTYAAVLLSLVGALTATALMVFYLIILINLTTV